MQPSCTVPYKQKPATCTYSKPNQPLIRFNAILESMPRRNQPWLNVYEPKRKDIWCQFHDMHNIRLLSSGPGGKR